MAELLLDIGHRPGLAEPGGSPVVSSVVEGVDRELEGTLCLGMLARQAIGTQGPLFGEQPRRPQLATRADG